MYIEKRNILYLTAVKEIEKWVFVGCNLNLWCIAIMQNNM